MEARPLTLLLQVFQDQGAMYSPRNKPAKETRPIDVCIHFVTNPTCIVSRAVLPSVSTAEYNSLPWATVDTNLDT